MRRFHLLVGTALAVCPVLLLYAHNARELHPDQLLRPLVVVTGVAVVLQALAFLWLRQAVAAALLAGVVVFGLQMAGHAVGLAQRLGVASGSARLLVTVVSLALLVALLVAAWRVRRRPHAWHGVASRLLVVATLLLVVQCARIAAVEWRAPTPVSGDPVPSLPAPRGDLPDIYLILLDGYGRSDVLRELYGFDNSAFLRELEQQGFHVARESYAHYVGTLWSLAALLNMQTLQELVDAPPTLESMNPLIRLVRSNRVVHLLRRAGYRIVSFASGYGVAEFVPDVQLRRGASLDDFEQLVWQTTPLPWWMPHRGDPHEAHRRRLQWIFDTLPEVPESDRPQFVFAHVLAPHPPFVFDAAGGAPEWPGTFALNDGSDYYRLGGTPAEYRRLYAGQARWVTDQVRSTLRRIHERHPDRPPVILLVSDHGPGSGLDWDDVDATDLWERFGILCAVSLPGAPALDLPQDLPPAGIFRLVFDLYLGTQFGPLPPGSWFSSNRHPFAFEDITSRLPTPAEAR